MKPLQHLPNPATAPFKRQILGLVSLLVSHDGFPVFALTISPEVTPLINVINTPESFAERPNSVLRSHPLSRNLEEL